jgi:zinc finger BED domain-containing protein 1 (E3 SUMO-protein ligase ZBED1)
MCSTLNPKASAALCSSTVSKETLKVKDQCIEAMKSFLVGQYFALKTDHWTSCANESYMAATLHFIDNGWEIRSLTLNCSHHSGETTGVLTKKLLKEAWESYNLKEEHLVAVVSDTAANMTAAGRLYPCPLIYCAAHTLELTSGIGFNDENIPGAEGTMKGCRALVSHFSHSSQATKKLLGKQFARARPIGVLQDVATRWWSTYAMTNRLLEIKGYLHALESEG